MCLEQMRLASVRMAFSKTFRAGANLGCAAGLIGGLEAVCALAGELRVDGQQNLAVEAGEANGELDDLLGIWPNLCVADELAGGEHLLEQVVKHGLGKLAARFDVGEDAGEVIDSGRELGHLAEACVDFDELVG